MAKCLGLKSYLQGPGDGRTQGRIPAAALLWALLTGVLLRRAAFAGIEALGGSQARRALDVSQSFGDGTFKAIAGPAISVNPMAAGDFNADGVTDLVGLTSISYSGAGTVSSFLTQFTETATATVSGITPAGAGPHKVVASYAGSTVFASSDSNAVILFRQPPSTSTTLTLTSATGAPVKSMASGGVVTLTAAVKDYGVGVTAGQVHFRDATAAQCTDIHLLGTAQLTSAGTAVLKLIGGS